MAEASGGARRPLEWFRRHRSVLLPWLIALLVAIVAVESLLLYEQRTANRAAETQSAKLLTTFLKGDTAQVSSAGGVPIRLQNVRFKWSDKVYIDTGNMAVRAVSVRGITVDFDDLDSFLLTLQQSTVLIRPEVLEGMFNESVFNYPNSKLRDLKVTLVEEHGKYSMRLTGKVDVVFWIPFSMVADLLVDAKTNTLVIDVDHLKLFRVVPATKLIRWTPMDLERVISLPPNKSLMVVGNRIMVKPFGLFPPPRVTGRMSKITMDERGILLSFAGDPIPAPEVPARNYVYLRGGTSQFGHIRMLDTNILILDKDPSDPFVFSLLHYADMVPRSQIEVHDTRSARVTMPDF